MSFFIRQGRASSLAAVFAVAVAVVIVGCCGDTGGLGTPEATTYKMTVSGVGKGAADKDTGAPPSGKRFKNWTITSDGVNFVSAETTFTMPASAVILRANFENGDTMSRIPSVRVEPVTASDSRKECRVCLFDGRPIICGKSSAIGLFVVIFSIATVFFACLAVRKSRDIGDIKKKRKKWTERLHQTIRNIEASNNLDGLKKSVGRLRTLFSLSGSRVSLTYSESAIGAFVTELEQGTRDNGDIVELKSEISGLLSEELTKNCEDSKQKINGEVRWRMLWIIMAVFSFLLFSASYCCLLGGYPCLSQEKEAVSKCIYAVGCALPDLSVFLLYCVAVINILFVYMFMRKKS